MNKAPEGVIVMFEGGYPIVALQVPARLSQSQKVRKVISHLAEAALRDPILVTEMEVAVGEAFSNAVKYGDRRTAISFKLESGKGNSLAVRMAYGGKPFDTTVTYPLDVLEGKGGLGRYIMTRVLDRMEYRFGAGGMTTLCMRKSRKSRS